MSEIIPEPAGLGAQGRQSEAEPSAWMGLDSAPRDGTWLLLRTEDYRVVLGRFAPHTCRIGSQMLTYEWQVLSALFDHTGDPDVSEDHVCEGLWDHWSEGYVCDWMPLSTAP